MQLDLRIRLDAERFNADLALLVEAAKRSPEIRDRVLGLLDSGAELFRLNADDLAAGRAGELRVRFEPSDGFAQLVAAAGARNV